ncbi:Rapid alkalinization factor [Carex littledalei]|uniref:Rapid alkalinization factor n=1 Tax=Carex littledalei TaxID=544730 RepID=A0A833QFM7_9POAL|nr:Rapid alkalinization factor [Carex littledalei]
MIVAASAGNQHKVVATRQLVETNGTTGYISYGALVADSVPCSVTGASYYNCKPGAAANPYTRSCTAITQCRD